MHNKTFRALSSVYGRIDQLLFAFPDSDKDQQELETWYRSAYKVIPQHVRFLVIAKFEGARETIGKRRERAYIRFIREFFGNISRDAPFERMLTVILCNKSEFDGTIRAWVQDPFMMLESAAGIPAILEQVHFRHARGVTNEFGAMYIADLLAAVTDSVIKPFPYKITGGKILVGDNYLLVSDSLLKSNREYIQADSPKEQDQAILEAYRVGLGVQDIIPVKPQLDRHPILLDHIDMFMNLGGKIFENGRHKELLFIGAIDEDSLFGGAGMDNPDVRALVAALDGLEQFFAGFNERGLEFKVVRIPLLCERSTRSNDVPHLYSYNNCLVEVYDRFRNVYMPRYYRDDARGNNYFAAVEARVERVYREYGFEPFFVDGNFMAVSNSRGSFHCLSKVLKRSHTDARSWDISYSHRSLRYNGSRRSVNPTMVRDEALPPDVGFRSFE